MRYHPRQPMLDLKAKLASAGLVTDEDIARVEQSKRKRGGGPGRGGRKSGGSQPAARTGAGPNTAHKLDVRRMQSLPRGEAYGEIRRWVERVRIDAPGKTPGDEAKTFHFATAKGQVGRLVVEPDVHQWLGEGSAGVIAYMSNHGLAHAVVPVASARALAEVFPLWLRVLAGEPLAGQIETVTPEPDTQPVSAPEPDAAAESEPVPE